MKLGLLVIKSTVRDTELSIKAWQMDSQVEHVENLG